MLREGERLGLLAGGAGVLLPGDDLDLGDPFGESQRGLERVGEAPFDPGPSHEPVDDDFDGVLLVAGQPAGQVGAELVELTVDASPREPLRRKLLQQRVVLAFAAPHHRSEDLEARPLRELEDPVDDLLGGLTGDHPTAGRAVRHSDPGVEKPQVVVDLGDRPDRRPRVARRGLLVDRDRRGQTLDEVDVGLVHLAEELPRVRGQRFDVPALAFGVDGVERQRRLPRAGQASEHDQLVAWERDVDVFEVVLARPADRQIGAGGRLRHWLIVPAHRRLRTDVRIS
jgi:hypothetical protein